jgi:uncharacterized Zn finger protein (UPF0148 family)
LSEVKIERASSIFKRRKSKRLPASIADRLSKAARLTLPFPLSTTTLFRCSFTIALQHVLARMEPSSQHEEHTGRAVIDCGPSVSNTHVSGAKHICQSCDITASSSNTASGHEPAPSANLSASDPEPSSAIGRPENARHIPHGFNTASFISSGIHAASSTPSGANTTGFTPSLSGPEPTRLTRPNLADSRGNGPEAEEEDDNTWHQRIDLRAVECCEKGIELSTPPFPFYRRWDSQYRKKKVNRNMARASDASYEQWTADGKPLCPNCGKRHPPHCSAPSRRKRQAEEPAEGSTARASRRRRAVPRGHRASAQAAPASMAPPPASSSIMPSWDQVIATPESRAQADAELSRRFDAASTARERADAFYSMFYPVSPSIPAVTAPAATQPIAHEDWPTQGGWPTQSDWQSQNIWSTYGDGPTQSTWSTHGDDWSTQNDWSSQGGWLAQDDPPNLGAQSTNPRPRGHSGRRQPRANRATRNRRN